MRCRITFQMRYRNHPGGEIVYICVDGKPLRDTIINRGEDDGWFVFGIAGLLEEREYPALKDAKAAVTAALGIHDSETIRRAERAG